MAKRNVVWTATAAKQRREILKYWTKHNGSTAYAKKLIKITADRIKMILRHPKAFKSTNYPGSRESSMGHFSIIYKLTEEQLIITAFWDNRQDSKRLLEIIQKENVA